MMQIIYDHQLIAQALMPLAIKTMQQFFDACKIGNTLTPPRHSIQASKNGGLTFTMGGETNVSNVIGFRVYDTFPNLKNSANNQLVAVYCNIDGMLKGLFIGYKLGAIRTAAINGLAIQKMSDPNSNIATIIGTGRQAQYLMHALFAVRAPKTVYIHSRNNANAIAFKERFRKLYNAEFIVDQNIGTNAHDNLADNLSVSDITLCATSSPTPILKSSWIKPNSFLASLGPKQANQHEMPLNITDKANLIVSDAPNQLQNYHGSYFLSETKTIKALELVSCDYAAVAQNGINLFLSTGRSGTEVMLGDAILNQI